MTNYLSLITTLTYKDFPKPDPLHRSGDSLPLTVYYAGNLAISDIESQARSEQGAKNNIYLFFQALNSRMVLSKAGP